MIVKAGIGDAELLSNLGTQTFVEAHEASMPKVDLDCYVKEKYNSRELIKQLSNPNNIFHLIKHETISQAIQKYC